MGNKWTEPCGMIRRSMERLTKTVTSLRW